MSIDYSQEASTVAGRLTLAQIEELIAKPMDTKPDKKFFIALSISSAFLINWCYLSWLYFLLWNWNVGK